MNEAALATSNKFNTVMTMFEKSKDQIAMALPRHMNADRMLRVALTSVRKTPKLLDCDPRSLVGAVMEASQLGLEPDGILGYAYLIPYKRTAQLQIGYRGFIELAHRSGKVTKIFAHVIHANDRYTIRQGLDPDLTHEPTSSSDEGEVIAAYAVVNYKEGPPDFEFMWRKDIEKIRKRSRASNEGPWITDYEEMCKKTVIRRLAKRLPLSPEFQRTALVDERKDYGIDRIDAATGEIINVTPDNRLREKLAEKKAEPSDAPLPEVVEAEFDPEEVPFEPDEMPPVEEVRQPSRATLHGTDAPQTYGINILGENYLLSEEDILSRIRLAKRQGIKSIVEDNDLDGLSTTVKLKAQAKYLKLIKATPPTPDAQPLGEPQNFELQEAEDEAFYNDLANYRDILGAPQFNLILMGRFSVKNPVDLAIAERPNVLAALKESVDKMAER